MLRRHREQARRARLGGARGASGSPLRVPHQVPQEPSLPLRAGRRRRDRRGEPCSRRAQVPRSARLLRLRRGRSDVCAGGGRGGRPPRSDDLLRRELHRRPVDAPLDRGRRKLALDGRLVRHVLERPQGKRAGSPARNAPAARRGQRAGRSGDGGRRPGAVRGDLVGGDHRHRRPRRRHAGQARRDRMARSLRTSGNDDPAREVSGGSRPGAAAGGVRRAAAAARGVGSIEGTLSTAWREVVARYRLDLILFLASLAAYALSSDGLLAHQSFAPHFVYQADAFLHGQLHLAVPQPPNLNDWVLRDGRWYVSFPPFPALLMVPFVAVFGLSFNDVAFTLLFAAANVALLYRLLRRLQPARPEWEHVALALIYGFGTLAWSCGIRGEVWFTAETIGVTLTLLYLHASIGTRHPVLAGLAVACAAIPRTPLAFSAIFFVFEALSPDGPLEWRKLRDPGRWRAALPRLVPFALAVMAVAIPMAWMNYVRF